MPQHNFPSEKGDLFVEISVCNDVAIVVVPLPLIEFYNRSLPILTGHSIVIVVVINCRGGISACTVCNFNCTSVVL